MPAQAVLTKIHTMLTGVLLCCFVCRLDDIIKAIRKRMQGKHWRQVSRQNKKQKNRNRSTKAQTHIQLNLASSPPPQVFMALTLAETLVKNCGVELHRAMANEKFMKQMKNIVKVGERLHYTATFSALTSAP